MRFSERVLAWLRRERGDAAEVLAEAEQRLDADLTRRERELAATPEEQIELLRDRMADNDADLEAIRERVRRSGVDGDGGAGPG